MGVDRFIPVRTFYSNGPKKLGICIHHQAGTARDLSGIFNSRQVSAHYSVGDDYIYQYVQEWDRAWHTGTDYGNNNLIGIETKNAYAGGDWGVSDATFNKLVENLILIAHNQGWQKLYWHGDKYVPGYVCMHKDLYATACPGPYLAARCEEAVRRANDIMNAPRLDWPLNVWNINGTNAQLFHVNPPDNDGYSEITCIANGKALDVAGGDIHGGAAVQLYKPNGTDAQKWRFEKHDGGYIPTGNEPFQIVSKLGVERGCLTIKNPMRSGAPVITYSKLKNLENSYWYYIDKGNGTGLIVNRATMLALDAVNGGL
jgi:hypothetical protein